MSADFRALCAELAAIVAEEYGCTNEYKSGRPLDISEVSGLLTRARAALAQPEGEGPALAIDVSDEAAWDLTETLGILAMGIATKAMKGRKEGVSRTVATAKGAILEWLNLHANFARPAPQPVPVAERLPEEGDCDAEGRCWIGTWSDIDGEPTFDWAYTSPRDWTWEGIASVQCWLPHWALPVPLPQGEQP